MYPMTTPSPCLSSIAELGFAIIPDVFGDQELATLLDDFYTRKPSFSRAGVRHALKYPEINRLAQDPRLVRLASETLGSHAFPYRATIFDKSQNSNWLVVWHQDTALPVRERREVGGWGPRSVKEGVLYAYAPASTLSKIVALRVHFDDSTEHNGPLRVLPRTHELGILTGNQIEQVVRATSPINCVVTTGGIVAMRPLIVHSSSKCMGSAPRRILHIEYATDRMIAEGVELAIV